MVAKITPEMISRKMGKSVKDVIFQLQSLGADVRYADDILAPEVIQAMITGKRLVPLTRPVITEDAKLDRAAPKLKPFTPKFEPPLPKPPVKPSSEQSIAAEIPEKPVSRPVAPTATLPTETGTYNPSPGELLWALRQMVQADRQQASNEVFIVHGHDNIRHAVANFLTSLSLRPIMLDDRPNRGQTVIEKLEEHAYASFAVVLLTPDDEGRKKDSGALNLRPRQNVVFELGYFFAQVGRHKVCALYVPGVELPSDIHGLLYIPLDESGGWKYQLQKELNAAGVPIRLPS
jgi:hypothetical protein